jgi:hypothetical protein
MTMIEKREMCYNNNITIDLMEVLLDISNGIILGFHKHKKELIKKGLVDELFKITDAGKLLISQYTSEQLKTPINLKSTNYYIELHNKLKEQLIKLTGKPQKKLKFSGNTREYLFLCNPIILENNIKKACEKFKMTDLDIIEDLLLNHCKSNNRLMEYYIIKHDRIKGVISDLYTDYCTYQKEDNNTNNLNNGNFIP